MQNEQKREAKFTFLSNCIEDELKYTLQRNLDLFGEEFTINEHRRSIGTRIFDLPTTHSGLVSMDLLCEDGFRPNVRKCTEEHYYGRNAAGEYIIKAFLRGELEFGAPLIQLLKKYSRVHLVSQAAHSRITQAQKELYGEHWRVQYEYATAVMIEDPGTKPPDYHVVWTTPLGVFVEFDDLSLAHGGLTRAQVQYRVDNWDGWYKNENGR